MENNPIQWGNPASGPAYGHSQSRHGSKIRSPKLMDRAYGTGEPQGQFYDDMIIVEAERMTTIRKKLMCNMTFYIQHKEAATRWRFEEYGADGMTKLELALWKFATEHNRHWSIFINGMELPFEYEPDLTTIFNEIPEVLELLLQENKEPAILDFFEQGTSIVLSMKRKNDTIWVEFQKTPPL
ncbi:MAG: hypothetical protein ACE5PV_06705, partial [Candidatus Poribacteria bacterium]